MDIVVYTDCISLEEREEKKFVVKPVNSLHKGCREYVRVER